MATKFPSVPMPSADVSSLHQAVSAMRQTVSLLIVNQQLPSEPTLTQAAQVFATTDHVAQAISNNPGRAGAEGPPGPRGPIGPAGPAGPPGVDSSGGSVPDAPSNGSYYGRINGSWLPVLGANSPRFAALPIDATNDGAAASAGVPVYGIYRNGSVLMVRVS